ncbi:MAG TPA: DUF4326 domain-containing protein [Noviherbaspirillum sp.]
MTTADDSTGAPEDHLLVALSKGFCFPSLFASKLDALTTNLGKPAVSVIQDDRGIAREYFARLGIDVISERPIPRTSMKRKLELYSHILVFWDGEDLADMLYFAQLIRKPIRVVPVQITKVRNKDKDEPYDVYIGRGTPWGNPFPIGKGGVGDTREDVIRKYREHFETVILQDDTRRKSLLSLRGYRLGCHCKPLACHGDIIAEYLNREDIED